MTFKEMNEPISIDESMADSRSLIMPHQQEAVNALSAYFEVEKDMANRNGLLVMPTGSGKTYTAVTWLLSHGVANGYRVVWLVHRQELVEQTYQEFRKQAPILKETEIKKLRVLPVSGVHMKMSMASRADVYVCSVASVANKYGYRFIERMIGAAGKRKLIIVVDEAHHAVAANYQKVIKRMTALNENRILLGLTATPKRMQESEQRKLQQMFNINANQLNKIGTNGYVYEVTLKQLLMSGYLAKPIYERINTEIIGEIEYQCTAEDEEFFMQYGELSEKLKSQIASSSSRNRVIVEKYVNNKERYGKTIVFAVNQMHAETLCEEFRKAGISCDYAVSGRSDAQKVIQDFKNNKFRVLVNVQILTEGSDVPDIETVFLTRQTNSDSLLMQMIGRGLRGEKAGGTKEANIVAFHDTWNTFAHWLDPGALDIFVEEKEEEDPEETVEQVFVAPDEEMLALLSCMGEYQTEHISEAVSEEHISERDLYLKLYQLMRASLAVENETPVYPCGWYSVIDDNGDDRKLLVFDCQLKAYKDIEHNIRIISGKISAEALMRYYFANCEIQPDIEELDFFLQYIEDSESMPPYFTFEMREAFEPKAIADTVNSLFSKEEEREQWLKDLYDRSAVLQQIYRYFYAFKKTVYDAMKLRVEAEIQTIDDREEYNIVENYYDLYALLTEIKEMYPLLKTDGLVKLAWSNNVVKSWFALCERFNEGDGLEFEIHVNKILYSPEIDCEVVKYLIFHELLHQNGYWNHDEEFRKREWQYPNSAELDGVLDTLMLKYNMDELEKDAVYNELHLRNGRRPLDESQESAEKTEEKTDLPKGVQIGFKYCRNCGNKLPDTARFCNRCGEKMDY